GGSSGASTAACERSPSRRTGGCGSSRRTRSAATRRPTTTGSSPSARSGWPGRAGDLGPVTYGGAVDRHQAAARSDLERLVARARAGELGPAPEAHRYDPAAHGDFRPAAVLLLFTPTTVPAAGFPGLDLFLVQRSPLLRAHPGQIALPGGGA